MEQDRKCPNCKVILSSDLNNCPLCGKHIDDQKEENKKSYPIYNTSFVVTLAWYAFLRALFVLAGITCVIVNLIFPSNIYWCLYVLAALIMVFCAFIMPLKFGARGYIKRLVLMSIFISVFLIFIDVYNHFNFKVTFGWSLSYVAPFVMLASVIASTILCFLLKRYEKELLNSVCLMAVLSIIYFIIEVTCFKSLACWPALALMCASIGLVIILQLFKRHKLITELSREFHL